MASMQHPQTSLREKCLHVVFGGHPLFPSDPREQTTRALLNAMFLAPVLFIAFEHAPTAWGVGAPLLALVFGYRLWTSAAVPTLVRPLGWLAGVLALVGVSTFWSVDPERTFDTTIVYASYAFLSLIMIQLLLALTPDNRERVWNAAAAGGAMALVGLMGFELWVKISARDEVSIVIAARTLHKLTFYGLIIAVILLFDAMRLHDPWRLTFVVVVFAVPTLAFGRSTGISLAILLVAALFLMRPRWRMRALTAFCAIYAVMALTAPFVAGPLYDILRDHSMFQFHVGTFAARLELWKMVSAYVWEASWLGHGADTMRTANYIVRDAKYYAMPDVPSAHNIVFDLWFDLGLAGVVVWLAVILVTTRAILRLTGAAQFACMAIFLTVVIELSVDHRIWLSWMMGTLIFAASICVLAVMRDKAPPVQSRR